MYSESFSYDVDKNFDFVIEENGNTFMALRKLRFGNDPDTPHRLYLKKYRSTNDGGETMVKGCPFISDDAAHELTRVLVEQNYGRPKELVETIKSNRPDIYAEFVREIKDIPDDKAEEIVNESQEEYYDLREVI